MTMLDRLFLVTFWVLFIWQVLVPVVMNKPVFPLVRKSVRKFRRGRK